MLYNLRHGPTLPPGDLAALVRDPVRRALRRTLVLPDRHSEGRARIQHGTGSRRGPGEDWPPGAEERPTVSPGPPFRGRPARRAPASGPRVLASRGGRISRR